MGPDILAQYGIVGFVAAVAIAVVRILFQREIKSHDLDRERADRLEKELNDLNEAVRGQYLTSLQEAQRALSEATRLVAALTDSRRGGS